MNKTQLICLLVAILIAVSVGAWIHARSHHRHYVQAHSRMIGEELIATTNSTRVIHLGSSLRSRLGDLLSSTARVEEVRLGDEFEPDMRADACIVLGNQRGLRIGIRIKQAEKRDKFHILGYWTITESQPAPE